MFIKKLGFVCLSTSILLSSVPTVLNIENNVYAENNVESNIDNYIRIDGNTVYVSNSYFYDRMYECYKQGIVSENDYLNFKSFLDDRIGFKGETKIVVVNYADSPTGKACDVYLNNIISYAIVGAGVGAVTALLNPLMVSVAGILGVSAPAVYGAIGAAATAFVDPGDGLIITLVPTPARNMVYPVSIREQ